VMVPARCTARQVACTEAERASRRHRPSARLHDDDMADNGTVASE
jgi:hypothetical protein